MKLAEVEGVSFLDDVRADLDFTAQDEARLQALAPSLEPILGELAETLKRRIIAQNPDASVERTVEWLRSGLRGPWDETFVADRAARAHVIVTRGLPSALIVTVVYHVRTGYLLRLTDIGASVADRLTIHKLVDLELAILLHTFEQETESLLIQRERRWQTEQRAAMQTLSIGFAHELRNPLNSAKLQLDVLERRIRRVTDQPTVAEPAALARQEIERLCELVEDFLAYAQPPPLAPVMCDIVTLAEHVVETEQPFARDHGVTLAIEPPSSRWHARVDGDKVRQAIANLVRNGLEAAPEGGHVNVQVTGVDGHVHVVVADNGSGIPEKIRSRMFEPFFSTKDTGTGLGMSIVQSVVAMHGGALDVASSPEGTRIDMALPRAV